jgi:LacI family transcriptional regulator
MRPVLLECRRGRPRRRRARVPGEMGMRKRVLKIAIGIDIEPLYKHHAGVVSGILRYAHVRRWECHLEPFIDSSIRSRRYDGVIARVSHAAAAYLKRARVPAVNVWVNSPDRTLARVLPDQRAAGRLAAAHLLERGYRRLAYIGQFKNHNCVLHLEGLRQALGKDTAPLLTHSVTQLPRNAQDWRRMQESLMDWVASWRVPLGVFAVDDLLCRYLTDVVLRRGLRIPEDVALIGCQNNELLCEHMRPALTSIEQGYERVGYRASKALDQLMHGAPCPKRPILIKPVGLVPRRSTEGFAVNDPILSGALRFIAEHSHERIGVDDLRAGLAVSRRSLERRFRKGLGRAVHEEIVRARLAHAKRLLVEPDRPIKAIARDAGFSSSEHFSRVFLQHEGVAPNAYRRERMAPFSASETAAPRGQTTA